MTYEEIAAMAEEAASAFGGRSAYYQWPKGAAPAPPYLLFYYPERDDFYADDENYQGITALNLELYTGDKDYDAEAAVETTLRAHGLSWAKGESYIESESLYEVIYQLEVMIHGDEH